MNVKGRSHPGGRFDVAALDYELPQDLIAQHPPSNREDARLLAVDSQSPLSASSASASPGQVGDCVPSPAEGGQGAAFRDLQITDLPQLLRPGDLLVLNDTKVLPARFNARRLTGGLIGGLFVREEQPGLWRVMLKNAGRLREGERLIIQAADGADFEVRTVANLGEGHWHVKVDVKGTAEGLLERIGHTPLPPYIRRDAELTAQFDGEDRIRYQTVYAREFGAVAAPTAGMHLTQVLLQAIRGRGVEIAFVTLHVGIGTFRPIAADRLQDHRMHQERYELSAETAGAVERCRERGGNVVAVGTTSVRVLESTADPSRPGLVEPASGSTDIFIYPPYRFRVVDRLLTNFHLPRSTLLALVMAFAGVDLIRRAYSHAIEERYRFYSYGDAMYLTRAE
ncbi:MAG: tRNA preQ1(34) S-adenosylmethionine ribosyltransferase-isomerase QueA [Phycisphaerales bacterium]|nr:MAG: tRNA preQ1(34) S-adenosylmethionine ribosyltransferase-isomerase QueA [Phycisphaerales bacterium]